MKYSYSRVSCFNSCKRKFKYHYIDELETLPNYEAQNALILGTAMHHGIEQDAASAIKEYYYSYPVITTAHIFETIKLEWFIPKVKELLKDRDIEFEFEVNIDEFKGFIDLLEKLPDGTYAIYDFKYSNNISGYLKSAQLHLYKYYFEKQTGYKVSKMGFIFIPKINIRQKKTETELQFIDRLKNECTKKEIEIRYVSYDEELVEEFKNDIKQIEIETEFEPNPTKLCDWCDFQKYCKEGEDTMILPKNERIEKSSAAKRKIWLYGAPFSGKTYLVNNFPDLLLLSTDGNYTQLPGGIPPHVDIKDIITVSGRITKKQFAWEVLKDVISELEKNENTFKTICLDLLEDTYESCRLYMYDQLGITHESDDSFRAWDKVRTEYLSTIKRLMNLNYDNIILISHEDMTKDITKKSGDKVTSIKPNLQEKAALKIAGMVDIVARIIADGDKRTISFKSDEVVFGGGRLNVHVNEIPCDYDELISIYKTTSEAPKTEVNMKPLTEEKRVSESTNEAQNNEKVELATADETKNEMVEEPKETVAEEPVRRVRKRRA